MSQSTPAPTPVPIDFDGDDFTNFAKGEPVDAVHLAACMTVDSSECETAFIEPVCLVYNISTNKYSVNGLISQFQTTKRITYPFKPDIKIYAIYRLECYSENNKLSTIREALRSLDTYKVDFVYGANIIPNFAKHSGVIKVINRYSDSQCAVIAHKGYNDYENVKVYFGKLSLTLNDSVVGLCVKNKYETVALKYSDITSIYMLTDRKALSIPDLPMIKRIGQFNEYVKTEINKIYGEFITTTMVQLEALYESDKAEKLLEEQEAAKKLLEEQEASEKLLEGQKAAEIRCDNVAVGDFIKAVLEFTKDKQSWTLTFVNGTLKLDVQ